MRFELFIALRYLLSRRKHSFISAISLISVAGVALGVAALIIVLGVMNGFSQNLRDKILGVNAHLLVTSYQGPFSRSRSIEDKLNGVSGVKAIMPFIYSEVMLSTPQGVKGSVLRGIDPDRAQHVLSLSQDLVKGDLASLQADKGPPGIVVGRALSRRLGLQLGERLNMLSPSGKKSAAGFTPEIKTFQVAGIFDTGMYEYDSSLVYVSIDSAQDILGFSKELITGFEVRLADIYAAREVAERIEKTLGRFPFSVQTWMEMNRSLFSALKLEKTAMAVILVMIVLVGSFSIVTTLIMLVMEKKHAIAILMSMGATPRNIKRIFIYQGSLIGVIGTFLGYSLGLGLSLLLERYHFIKLPSEVYYLDHLPIQLETPDLLFIGLAAMGLCFLATLYPAGQAAKLHPAEVLRYE
jgi:lipoprotein-releasing system permease protein